jgi:hypothetical protein
MILLLAAPAAAATRLPPAPRDLFDVPRPAVPPLDVVRQMPGEAGARIASTASGQRYSIGDGSEDTIAVDVTSACEQECTAADPQAIADTVGTFIHGAEVDLLTVQLDTPFQLGFDCGFDAESCYYSGENKIVLSGDEEVDSGGANREFVLAHEYGHHVAQHRQIPPPFGAAINWGTERWSSYEHVCQGHREGALFPGNEGSHYYEDPGEAFAESFAHNRFPDMPVSWSWDPALRPNAAAFRAIRADTLSPWEGRTSFTVSGRVPRRGAAVEEFRTPLDGEVSVGPANPSLGYELAIRSPSGKVLRNSREGVSFHHRLDYTVCGQSRLRVAVQAHGAPGRKFHLTIQRP